MLLIGILLIVAAVIFFVSGTVGYGDIGVLAIYIAITALLSGIGFVLASVNISKLKK